MGFEGDAEKIQKLYLAGKTEAAMAVPDALADEISLVGPVDKEIGSKWTKRQSLDQRLRKKHRGTRDSGSTGLR